MKKKYFLFIIIIIIFIASILLPQSNNKKKYKDKQIIQKNSTDTILVSKEKNKIELLQEENNNEDIKAVLSINNSNFSEVVVQTIDNKYYLTHDYKKKDAKLGAIYADYRINLDNSKKVLIYGHSSKKTNVPFNYLENYYDKEFFENHKYITLQTKNNIYKYEIFSVYVETSDFTYMNLNFDSNKDWYLHLLKLQRKSMHKTNIELMNDDEVLILQTCSTNPKYQKYSKKYLLIVSRRVTNE